LKNAKDVSALKAVRQNLMHANLCITDGVYGILSEAAISKQIVELGKQTTVNESANIRDLVHKLLQILASENSNIK
jgi:hypothetical protein